MKKIIWVVGVLVSIGVAPRAQEYPSWEVHGRLALAGQSVDVQEPAASNRIRTEKLVVFRPELSLVKSPRESFFVRLGFADRKGLHPQTPFALSPWAADAENELRVINGHDGDHVLNAWYRYALSTDNKCLSVTGGIIDSADHLDTNAFANDEYLQFMNQTFVNSPVAFLPSYDTGVAMESRWGSFSLNAVGMSVGQPDDLPPYSFGGAQLGYHRQSSLGEGNFRLTGQATNARFSNVEADALRKKTGVGLSCDQEFGPWLGVWTRLATQSKKAETDFANLYSGGVSLRGAPWGRCDDTVGFACALLNNGNKKIRRSEIKEVYVHLPLTSTLSAHVGSQWIHDSMVSPDEPRAKGWVNSAMIQAGF